MNLTADGLDLFVTHGARAIALTGEPLLLRGSTNVWRVAEGRVDVFLVRLNAGRPDGALSPLFRVETGQLMFGLPDSVSIGWAIAVVGAPGHRLEKLERANWIEPIGDVSNVISGAAIAIDAWISQMAALLLKRSPADAITLEAGREYVVEAGQVLLAAHQNLWFTEQNVELRFLDSEAALFATDGAQGVIFPLAQSAWMVAASCGVITTYTTVDALRSSKAWDGLDAFNSMVQSCLIERVFEQERLETERLAKKVGHEADFLESAMRSLASVLQNSGNSQEHQKSFKSPVAAAMQLVGQSAGFTVTAPPARHTEGDNQRAQRDEVADITEASRIRRRSVALKGQWWKSGGGPLLGFLEAGLVPVALLPSAGGYSLHDPTNNTVLPLTPELADTLSPFAFSFYRSFGDKKMTLLDLMKFGSHGLIRDYLLVCLMGVSVGLLGMVVPIVTGMLFDTAIPGADRSQLLQLTLALLAGAFASAMFEVTRDFAMLRAEGKMDASIQAGVWDRLLRLPVPFFRDFSAGDLAIRANGINEIRQALSGTTLSSIFSAVFSLFNLILLFYYSAVLALVALALVMVAVLFTVGINLLALRQERELAEVSGRLSGMVFEFLGAISKLRATGSETRAFHQWALQFAKQQRHQFKSEMAHNAVGTFNAVFPIIANIAIFAMIAFYMKDSKDFTTGQFLAFNAAFGGLMGAMLSATQALTSVLNIIPIYERAKPILLSEPEISSSKAHPGQLEGEIEINQLSFSYSADGPKILQDISLQIKPGEFVALVGASGSGKSTLLRLLLGFETPSAGSIYFDRQDMAGLDLGALRRQLGVVLQNGQLLAGDVFTNIIGSAATLTLDHAWNAATQAGLAEDIRKMPMGMHTVVSDGGGTLSGGQRQRVLIARAIVNRPRIVIFDEATSALDNQAQAMVSESLEKLNATRIVIAHRLSTIVNADRILVLDAGRLVQSGNYSELMSQQGLFAELARRQIA